MKSFDIAVGPCPKCGKKEKFWYNDIPLRAFCWGTEDKPHKEWSKRVPEKVKNENTVHQRIKS